MTVPAPPVVTSSGPNQLKVTIPAPGKSAIHGTGKSGTSSTTTGKPYTGPGAKSSQAAGTSPRILSDIDTLLNAHGVLGSLNVVDDVKVILARTAVVGAGFVLGIGGLVIVISSIWGKVPQPVKTTAEDTGGAAVAAGTGLAAV